MQQMQFRHRTAKKHKCRKHESDEAFRQGELRLHAVNSRLEVFSVEPLPPWMRPRAPALHVEMRNAYQHFAAEVCPRFTNHRIPVPTIHNRSGKTATKSGRDRHETWHRHCGNHEARGYRD